MSIAERWERVRSRVAHAAREAGRSPEEVSIVAVSKTFGLDVIEQALEAGIVDLGENRAQELKEKRAAVGERARWHFIGHLQSNKVRTVVGITELIHSVDRVGVAEAISRRATALGIAQRVLVEVNVAHEASKHGVEPARAPQLCEQIAELAGVELCGLMTMPPLPARPEDSRPHYDSLRRLRDLARAQVPSVELLSMGTTRDLEVAVAEGATHLRVGEAIFGPRRSRP